MFYFNQLIPSSLIIVNMYSISLALFLTAFRSLSSSFICLFHLQKHAPINLILSFFHRQVGLNRGEYIWAQGEPLVQFNLSWVSQSFHYPHYFHTFYFSFIQVLHNLSVLLGLHFFFIECQINCLAASLWSSLK